MSVKEPKSMQEIHKIREKQFLETNRMNREEEKKYFHKKIESLKAKHNISLPILHATGHIN